MNANRLETPEQWFSAFVRLNSTVRWGPGQMLRSDGMAERIDARTVEVSISTGHEPRHPQKGDRVALEVELPKPEFGTPPRSLCMRGRVIDVSAGAPGSVRLVLMFRRVTFQNCARAAGAAPLSSTKWEM